MIRCLSCNAAFPSGSNSEKCPACEWTPSKIEGFTAYAPEFANSGGGFEPEYFDNLAALEAKNFWFRSRNRLLQWAIRRFHPDLRSFLEVGCGTGFVLSGIQRRNPHARIAGSEIFAAGLKFAAERLSSVSLMQMDARNIPFVEEFDVVGAFDVIEHIQEDELVLSQLHAALKENGTLMVTVPQHPWLWSTLDEYSHHFRRYTEAELRRKIEGAGFEIIKNTSFVTLLLPAMALSRLVRRDKPVAEIDVRTELQLPAVVNAIFNLLLSCEIALIKAGLSLPAGGSRLVVARKRMS
ncbi:methyltransferase domain-containing protein [Rhizobium hidalgonense]|uniref:Methyltransferase domain-containing protein n=1 Tax=Rhizobium hidalgonense TaxID=1538159 RepID=A0AAJ2H4J6_9HYPH|nr:methyltransferase domain-containing protein [Rhizobium hidalgonense]MDR9777566.1 methyltransferase domain-containing protein [Rhizobium hidalgonense]MDR9823909.1 methyltransferase domain-containing protein [Rhizobium hidalgonense]